MKSKVIPYVVFILGSVLVYFTYFEEKSNYVEEVNPSRINYNNANDPVLMVGCKTFEAPEKAEIIYPTIKQNFLALTCALEVPPHYGVIALKRIEHLQAKLQK